MWQLPLIWIEPWFRKQHTQPEAIICSDKQTEKHTQQPNDTEKLGHSGLVPVAITSKYADEEVGSFRNDQLQEQAGSNRVSRTLNTFAQGIVNEAWK